MKYVNNAWSTKMLQRDLAVAQFTIDEAEFRQAIDDGAKVVIGHPDTAEMFGVKMNRQTLVLEPNDMIYVCELNADKMAGRLPAGITQLAEIPEGFWFRFLKMIVFEVPEEVKEKVQVQDMSLNGLMNRLENALCDCKYNFEEYEEYEPRVSELEYLGYDDQDMELHSLRSTMNEYYDKAKSANEEAKKIEDMILQRYGCEDVEMDIGNLREEYECPIM